ncbi:DsbE family thiol:disulfide interchange protein [Planktotalea arctica]|uniref:DsbE family thiol:disulfide interchange protein n=1 Tax=Planktotalea arctica TaxID=1481893 RepID=UPI00321AD329
MAKIPPLMIAPPAIFLGLAVLFYLGMFREGKDELESVFIGGPAPQIETAAELPGFAAVTQADLARGEVTLVNFWASWCPPCRAEHPKLLELAKDYPIIGVNFKDTARAATKYLNDDGNPFVGVAFDPKGRTAIDWGVTAPPETFILDKDGTVLYRFAGPLVGSDFEQRFLRELNKALAK